MPSIIVPILQYGIPAGIQGIHFLEEMIGHAKTGISQEEFNARWAATRQRYLDAGHAWDEAGQSPLAKA